MKNGALGAQGSISVAYGKISAPGLRKVDALYGVLEKGNVWEELLEYAVAVDRGTAEEMQYCS